MATNESPKTGSALKLKDIVSCVGSLPRWRMLVELGKGEPLPTSELAKRIRMSPNAASKHLVQMHKAGLLDRGYGDLYRIPERFLVSGEPVIDYGALALRLDYPDPQRK